MIRKKIIVLLTIFALLMPMSASAASGTVKMKTYDEVIKSGNTVFCSGHSGLYKVKLKGKKVKSVKCLYKIENSFFEGIKNMRKSGKYLYYIKEGSSYYSNLYRITTSGKKRICFTPKDKWGIPITGYAIKGKKLYLTEEYDSEPPKVNKYVMKKNGKNKKKTKVRAVMIRKKTNAKGYSVVQKEKNGYYYDYLKTPAGKFYLGKSEVY